MPPTYFHRATEREREIFKIGLLYRARKARKATLYRARRMFLQAHIIEGKDS